MEIIKHCEKFMELKTVGTRFNEWDLFFQCKKCGKVLMRRIELYKDLELNNKLKEDSA